VTAVATPHRYLRGSPSWLPSPQPTTGPLSCVPPWITSRDGSTATPHASSALHPELAKRSLGQASSDPELLTTLTARQMVEATAGGEGTREDPGDRRIEVEHLHGTIANVTVRSAVYVEYLQLVHTRRGWKIVNTLWARA
jgi:hypothetical protein